MIMRPNYRFTIVFNETVLILPIPRYVEVMPHIMEEIVYILDNVPMSGGLLNECNVAYREWAPPGCAQFELCLQGPPGKLEMCVIPEYSWG